MVKSKITAYGSCWIKIDFSKNELKKLVNQVLLIGVCSQKNGDVIIVTFDTEILPPVFRKWNLYNALSHDINFCCNNTLWSQKGESVLKHTLATIDHFIGTFYDAVKAEHPLVLINLDVDAICASMILFTAFDMDDVHYTVAYVDSPSTFESKLKDQCGKTNLAKHVILINCYGHLSLADADLLRNDIKYYIIDSRRPFHLDNVFSNHVSILTFSNETSSWNLPRMEQIYMESDSSSGDEDMEDGESDRRLILERKIIKRATKDEWRRKRADTMWNYYAQTWYSIPSSVLLLELAHAMGKSNVHLAWCAAVALSSQYMDYLITFEQYSNTCMNHLRKFVVKYAPKGGSQKNGDVMNITFDTEILPPLFRKWNLYNALSHDINFCCNNTLWSQKGESVLKHTLATIGITLQECHQSFDSLASVRRKEIFEILSKHLDTSFVTFFSEFGYHQRYSSIDFARILASKLELKLHHTPNDDLIRRVEDAKELLYSFFRNNGHDKVIPPAIREYQKGLDAIRGLVFNVLHHSLVTAGAKNFLVLTLDPASDIAYLSSRHFINLFVHFVHNGSSRRKKRLEKPLIIFIPSTTNDENNRYWIITGAMPLRIVLTEAERRSSLPIAFRKVAEQHHIPVTRDTFDPNILQIRHEDKVKFIESLDMMLGNLN